jgi:hypothetical protein
MSSDITYCLLENSVLPKEHIIERYLKFINYCKNIEFDCYTETHHIIPRSFKGTDDNINLIKLGARHHYIAHFLLARATNSPKMINAPAGLGQLLNGTINKYGSDIERSDTVPNLSTLDLDALCNGYSDPFGVFQLRNNSPNINKIVRACRWFPIKLYPYGGNSLSISPVTPNVATTGDIIFGFGLTLSSSTADYVILQPLTIDVGGGPVDVWQVVDYKKNV